MTRMSLRIDPTTHEWAGLERLIIFDGICTWCNAWVNFIIARDRGRFQFATLQSDKGQQLLRLLGLPEQDFETFLLLEHGQVFVKSTAALKIAKHLSGCWPLLYLFILLPRALRDAMYTVVATATASWEKPGPVVSPPPKSAADSSEHFAAGHSRLEHLYLLNVPPLQHLPPFPRHAM